MVSNHKPTGRALSMPAGLTLGAVVSLGITLLLTALIAKLVESEYMQQTQIGYGVMVMLMAASFLGALSAAGKIKRQRLVVCALSGLVYFGILMSITALFFGGQYEAVGVTGILVMGSAMLAVLAESRTKRRGNRRKIKAANR